MSCLSKNMRFFKKIRPKKKLIFSDKAPSFKEVKLIKKKSPDFHSLLWAPCTVTTLVQKRRTCVGSVIPSRGNTENINLPGFR